MHHVADTYNHLQELCKREAMTDHHPYMFSPKGRLELPPEHQALLGGVPVRILLITNREALLTKYITELVKNRNNDLRKRYVSIFPAAQNGTFTVMFFNKETEEETFHRFTDPEEAATKIFDYLYYGIKVN